MSIVMNMICSKKEEGGGFKQQINIIKPELSSVLERQYIEDSSSSRTNSDEGRRGQHLGENCLFSWLP